jgi:multimeric flavodoxin WrbA
VLRDGYENMGALIHQADEAVIMSRYTWGGFSSFVKNVFDRCLGYVLPEFETAYGEMHHKKRYPEDKPVTFIFRGSGLTEEEQKKARNYVYAVCRNLRGYVKDVMFEECAAEPVRPSDAPKERKGILLVNGSIRGDRSNTGVLLKRLQEVFRIPVNMVTLAPNELNNAEIAEAVNSAETVILGIPLYVDGIPASALRLMETVDACQEGTCRVYAVINNGLYESRQNVNLLNMIRDWSNEKGFRYSGALAVGAGEVIGTLMRDTKHILWPANNTLNGLKRLRDAVLNNTELEDIYADPYRFPRWLYILIANTNWQSLKAAEKRRRNRK